MEYGWWGKGGIFGGWGSWVKYGEIWKEWGEVREGMGRYVGGVGSVGVCEKVGRGVGDGE